MKLSPHCSPFIRIEGMRSPHPTILRGWNGTTSCRSSESPSWSVMSTANSRSMKSALPSAGTGAKRGLAAGAVAGLIFPPASSPRRSPEQQRAVSSANCEVTGIVRMACASSESDLPQGHAGIVALVDESQVEKVSEHLTGYEDLQRATVNKTTLEVIEDDPEQ